MCEVDCLQCFAGTCVCPAGYGGFGEGTNDNGCALNYHTIEVLWQTALATSVFGVVVSTIVLVRWLYGGGVDWGKLVTNRNFQLLFNVFCMDFLFGIIAILRIQGVSFVFNDAGATIIYVITVALVYVQCNLLMDLCHDTLVGLLAALGVKDGIAARTLWQKRLFLVVFICPYIPILVSPGLDFAGRRIMVILNLVNFALGGPAVLSLVCVTGEQAIKLLKAIGTEATVLPRRRIRMLLLNFYCTGAFSMSCHVLIIVYIENFPYFLPAFCLVYAIALVPPILGLSYDRSKITRTLIPSTSGKPGSAREPSSPSTTKETAPKVPTTVEMASIEPQGSVEPQKAQGAESA